MPRIYYSGDSGLDERLAGVDLHYGVAVDVPDELGQELLGEGDFGLEEPTPLEVEEWYEAPPGEELIALDGVGPALAKKLTARDVSTLEDMADLTEHDIVELAEDLPRVTEDMMRSWVFEARRRAII